MRRNFFSLQILKNRKEREKNEKVLVFKREKENLFAWKNSRPINLKNNKEKFFY
jgi:hypothetical protein